LLSSVKTNRYQWDGSFKIGSNDAGYHCACFIPLGPKRWTPG
jgi:hypothetical protein